MGRRPRRRPKNKEAACIYAAQTPAQTSRKSNKTPYIHAAQTPAQTPKTMIKNKHICRIPLNFLLIILFFTCLRAVARKERIAMESIRKYEQSPRAVRDHYTKIQGNIT
jgi:hypothetical protein